MIAYRPDYRVSLVRRSYTSKNLPRAVSFVLSLGSFDR